MKNIFGHRNKYVAMAGLLVFLIGLAVIAYLGLYNRYWADDWCYNADFRRLGFLGTMKGYTHITTYASNRFSLTLFSGLLYFGGLFGVQIMTLIIVIFWTWGLYGLFKNINTMTSLGFSRVYLLLPTSIIVYYSIYLAPHMYQSIYWRSGLLPYTAPIVFGIWVFVLITSQAVHETHSRLPIIFTSILSFLGGGFSEAGAATLTAMLAIYVLIGLIFRKKKWSKDTFVVAMPALLWSTAALVALIVSPTTAYRVGLYDTPASLAEYPRMLSYYTYEFLATNVLQMPLTHFVIFGTLLLVGALAFPWNYARFNVKTWMGVILVLAILTFLFVAASFSPSVYIERGLPAPRTRIIAQFIFVLGYGSIAFVSGQFLKLNVHQHQLTWIIPLILIVFLSFGMRSVFLYAGKVSLYAERAAVWDERDYQIRQAKDKGILEVHVSGIDGFPVGGILDFADKRGPGFWVNNCAKRYYGVEAVYADQP